MRFSAMSRGLQAQARAAQRRTGPPAPGLDHRAPTGVNAQWLPSLIGATFSSWKMGRSRRPRGAASCERSSPHLPRRWQHIGFWSRHPLRSSPVLLPRSGSSAAWPRSSKLSATCSRVSRSFARWCSDLRPAPVFGFLDKPKGWRRRRAPPDHFTLADLTVGPTVQGCQPVADDHRIECAAMRTVECCFVVHHSALS